MFVVEQLTPVRHREGFEELAGLSNGRPVSVGVTDAGLFPEDARANAFADEVRKMLAFEHQNVARTLAIDGAGLNRWAVAWERHEGPTLDRVLAEKGPLLPDEAVPITMAIAQALIAAHAKGILHGGLTTQWVTLLPHAMALEVKVAGFGLGLLPTLVAGRKISQFVDVSGLGSLLHQLLTGELPMGRIGALPATSMHLGSVLSKSLGLDLSNRFRTVEEFASALGEANRTRVSGGHVVPGSGPLTPVGVRTLGPWELISLLGEGAMGQVFLAKHSLLGRQAAIKVLRPEQYQRADLIQRFFQEARSVNQINHEHIVEISDFGQEVGPDGKPTAVYFVMELLTGSTLTARLAKGPLAIDRTLHIVKQVASALAAAHRLGVVHRDVKTDNVFLISRHGDAEYVKVLDFGVAKLTQLTPDAPTISTMDGAIIGTPTSMSPEQASGGVVDQRADVYALGVLSYLLLAGKLPIDGENFGKLIALLLTKVPDPLPANNPLGDPIPPWLSDLVRRCLEKDPLKRPQSMNEVLAVMNAPPPVTVRSVAPTEPVLPIGVDEPASMPPPTSRKGLYAGLAAFALIAAAIAVKLFWPQPLPELPKQPEPIVTVVVDAGLVQPEEIDAGLAVAVEEPEDVPDAGAPSVTVAVKVPVKPAKPVKLTPALVKSVIEKQGIPKFSNCSGRFQASWPANGQIPTTFSIDKAGHPNNVTIVDGTLAEPLRNCLQKALSAVQFPVNTGLAQRVSYIITRDAR